MNENGKKWAAGLSNLCARDTVLIKRAVETLEGNIHSGDSPWYPYRCITPFRKPEGCPGIWNWDTAFHAMTVSRWDPALAEECLEGFMNFQREDGLFPDVIFGSGTREMRFGKPPVLATACETVYKRSGNKLFLKRAYMRLVHYEAFMEKARKFDGLFYYDATPDPEKDYDLFVRYESGWDNSVRWDDPCVNYWPIDLNCFMVMTYRSLGFMAQELKDGELAKEYREKESALIALVEERLWNEDLGAYTDKNRLNGKASGVITPASFMPLFIGIAPMERAEKMNAHAENPDEFYPAMPSVAYNNPQYSREYWRGPTWLNIAYFAAKGLENYGFKTGSDIREWVLNTVTENADAIRENYDSRTGEGLYSHHFSWSACFVIEFILGWD